MAGGRGDRGPPLLTLSLIKKIEDCHVDSYLILCLFFHFCCFLHILKDLGHFDLKRGGHYVQVKKSFKKCNEFLYMVTILQKLLHIPANPIKKTTTKNNIRCTFTLFFFQMECFCSLGCCTYFSPFLSKISSAQTNSMIYLACPNASRILEYSTGFKLAQTH